MPHWMAFLKPTEREARWSCPLLSRAGICCWCSRGSALLAAPEGEELSLAGFLGSEVLSDYRFLPGNGLHRDHWIRTVREGGGVKTDFQTIRPLPRTDDWFENVWNEYNRRREAAGLS